MNYTELAENLGLEEEDYRELVELFLETGRNDFEALQAALQGGDAETVSQKSHTLCGAAGNLGIMNFYEVAKRIELAALDGRLDGLSDDLQALATFFDEITRSLKG